MAKTIRKVLLIQPPAFTNNERNDTSPTTSLGIGYIAAVLEREGYEVKILDAYVEGWSNVTRVSPEKLLIGMPFSEIEEFIAAEAPDVVGISSMFTIQRRNAHHVAYLAKKVNLKIKVIAGGAHPTSAPESVLGDPNIDVVVLGEGDNTILPLLRALESDAPLTSVDGIAYRKSDGRITVQSKTNQIEHLDELPYPARHLMPMEKYFAVRAKHGEGPVGSRAASMITSRGCQYRCNFCTAYKVFTRVPRMRSVENIAGEIKQLITRYHVDEIFFEDDQFIAKTRHTDQLLDALAEFNLAYDTPNGVSPWLLDEKLISKMKKAGWHSLCLAIESGNQDILKNVINKPVKLDDVPDLVRIARKHRLDLFAYLVVGNITHGRVETLEEVRDSLRFVRKLRLRPQVSFLTGYPGSEVLEIAEKNGYLIPGFNWDNHSSHRQQMQTPLWSAEELRQVVEGERLKTMAVYWFTNPRLLFRTIWEYLTAKDKRNPLLGARKFAKFLKDVAVVGLTELGAKFLSRKQQVGPTWGLKDGRLLDHQLQLVQIGAPPRENSMEQAEGREQGTNGHSHGRNGHAEQLTQINIPPAKVSEGQSRQVYLHQP